MNFQSYEFILVFFPIVITGYFLFGKISRSREFLLISSLLFCYLSGIESFLFLVFSIILNFMCSKLIKKRKVILIAGITLNILFLSAFKYSKFMFGKSMFSFVPLGISFITFQQVAYLVDVYRDSEINYNLLEYASFVSFFPTISSGPIAYHYEVIPQLNSNERQSVDWENIVRGFSLFIMGLSKKVLIADVLGQGVNWAYSNINSLNAITSIVVMLAFTFQIYLDFSGYSDMAIGMSRMMNIDLPINFNSPYKAKSLDDFWGRWHMTLTRFFREYIYYPLGGNRKGKLRSYVNQMIVFLISGLWHGPNITFVIWGLLNGLVIVFNKMLKDTWDSYHPTFKWTITFLLINVLWIFFRASTLSEATSLIKIILGGNYGSLHPNFVNNIRGSELNFLLEKLTLINARVGRIITNNFTKIIFFVLFAINLNSNSSNDIVDEIQFSKVNIITLSLLLAYCILSLSRVATFIYVNF